MMRSNKVPWTTAGLVAALLLVAAFWAIIGYVAVHFISKFW